MFLVVPGLQTILIPAYMVPMFFFEVGTGLWLLINETFARLESSFEQLRRFTADASHELRTPLSVIRGIGEVGLGETRTPAEYKEAMGSMLEEVDRLTNLVYPSSNVIFAAQGDLRKIPPGTSHSGTRGVQSRAIQE